MEGQTGHAVIEGVCEDATIIKVHPPQFDSETPPVRMIDVLITTYEPIERTISVEDFHQVSDCPHA